MYLAVHSLHHDKQDCCRLPDMLHWKQEHMSRRTTYPQHCQHMLLAKQTSPCLVQTGMYSMEGYLDVEGPGIAIENLHVKE